MCSTGSLCFLCLPGDRCFPREQGHIWAIFRKRRQRYQQGSSGQTDAGSSETTAVDLTGATARLSALSRANDPSAPLLPTRS